MRLITLCRSVLLLHTHTSTHTQTCTRRLNLRAGAEDEITVALIESTSAGSRPSRGWPHRSHHSHAFVLRCSVVITQSVASEPLLLMSDGRPFLQDRGWQLAAPFGAEKNNKLVTLKYILDIFITTFTRRVF